MCIVKKNNKQTTDEIQQKENIREKEGMTEDKVGGEDFTLEKKLLFSYVNEQEKLELNLKTYWVENLIGGNQ